MLRSHLEPYTFNFGKSFVAFLVAFIPKTVNLLPIGTTFKVTDESWEKTLKFLFREDSASSLNRVPQGGFHRFWRSTLVTGSCSLFLT